MRQQASGGDGVWRASGSGALRRDLWRRLEKRRAELRREGLGEGEKQPSESLRTLSHRGNTDLVCDSDAESYHIRLKPLSRSPHRLSARHQGSVADGRGDAEATAALNGGGGAHHQPQPHVAK